MEEFENTGQLSYRCRWCKEIIKPANWFFANPGEHELLLLEHYARNHTGKSITSNGVTPNALDKEVQN